MRINRREKAERAQREKEIKNLNERFIEAKILYDSRVGSWQDWIFPKRCVGCGKTGNYVCDKCEVGMWEEEQICPVCGKASRYGLRHLYCKRSWSMEGLSCFWAYDGNARKLIRQAKYRYYYDFLGELVTKSLNLGERPEYNYLLRFISNRPLTVPVPLYFQRERERGFNQAAVITRVMSGYWALDTSNLLVRVRDTGRQVGRTREERLKAMEGAFQMNVKLKLKNSEIREVLLVDDVWTTGATMNECTRVLKRGGVKRVWGVVLAR